MILPADGSGAIHLQLYNTAYRRYVVVSVLASHFSLQDLETCAMVSPVPDDLLNLHFNEVRGRTTFVCISKSLSTVSQAPEAVSMATEACIAV